MEENNPESKIKAKIWTKRNVALVICFALFLVVSGMLLMDRISHDRELEANLYAFEETLLHFRIPYKDIYLENGYLVVEYAYNTDETTKTSTDLIQILGTYTAYAIHRNEDLLIHVYADGNRLGDITCKHRWAELYISGEIDGVEYYSLATGTLEWIK
jgi:hypothetical protein